MKIAITGGAGFIGTALTRAYLDAGHDVLVIDSLAYGATQPALDPRARFYQVDIRDEQFCTILQHERPDLVSHHVRQRQTIPIEQALTDADVHVRGLLHVLESCVHASVKRIIFASGGNDLYGNVEPNRLPVGEDEALCPQSAHDISNVAGEWYVRYYTHKFGLKHTILRYADVYGTDARIHTATDHHPLPYFLHMLRAGKRPVIRGTGDELRDHISLEDVVQANLQALKRGENSTLHISSGQGYSLNQLYTLVAEALESEIEPLYLSGPLHSTAAVILDNTRARHVLHWTPEVSLQKGIARAIGRTHELRPPVATIEEARERVTAHAWLLRA